MKDFLLEVARRPAASFLYRRLPMPMDLPPMLQRSSEPWTAKPLAGTKIRVTTCGTSAIGDAARRVIGAAGGDIVEGEATALVADVTGVRRVADLEALYAFLHAGLAKLGVCGRVLFVGRRADGIDDAEESACQEALVGLVRSVAKEIGKRGATAQAILLPSDTSDAVAAPATRLAGPLVYFLSARSAFVTGQILRLDAAVPPPTDLERRWVGPLVGKNALVTGAARGIGATIAKVLAREGAAVIGVDHPSQENALEETMRALGGRAVSLDLADDSSASAIVKDVNSLGGLDVLVNNAGITRDRTLAKMPVESWKAVLRVNLEAPLRIVQALTGGDLLRSEGRILFLSSVVGIAGNFGQTNYAAAKSGLLGLMRTEARHLAERGITANAIAPGFIDTPMTQKMPFMARELGRRMCSLKQGGLPEDVAEAAVFLASPGAFAVNGEVLRVCGQSVLGA